MKLKRVAVHGQAIKTARTKANVVMLDVIQKNRLTCACIVCLAASWILLASLMSLGSNTRPNIWWVQLWAYSAIFFAPLSVLLGGAGLIFDRHKWVAGTALVLALFTSIVVFSIGG